MKVPIVTVGRTLASLVAGFAKLLLLPFTHDGFKPLYPLLKSKAVIVFLTILGTLRCDSLKFLALLNSKNPK